MRSGTARRRDVPVIVNSSRSRALEPLRQPAVVVAIGDALGRLAAADLVRLVRAEPAAGPRWRFKHALLHEVAYQNLLLARRTDLHQRAGLALEDMSAPGRQAPADGEAPNPRRLAELEALGHHWSLSSDKARGARYLLAAGDRARAVYANDDAIRHFERALRTLAEAPADTPAAAAEIEPMVLDARERLADLFGLQGRRAEALAQYEQVRQAAGERHEPVRLARALRKTGGLHWEAGDRERAGDRVDAGRRPGGRLRLRHGCGHARPQRPGPTGRAVHG